jgi:type II secretory pathway pseudopilin PulG
MASPRGDVGFSLIEVLVVAALLVVVAVGVAEIGGRTLRANAATRSRTAATLAAVQKMEQLRSLTLSAAADATTGALVRVTDLTADLSAEPAGAAGPGLSSSPAGTLDDNVPPYVDYLDATGTWVGGGVTPPPSAVYIRRWAVTPLPDDPEDSVVLQVVVLAVRDAIRPPAGRATVPGGDVRLVSVKTRRAS